MFPLLFRWPPSKTCVHIYIVIVLLDVVLFFFCSRFVRLYHRNNTHTRSDYVENRTAVNRSPMSWQPIAERRLLLNRKKRPYITVLIYEIVRDKRITTSRDILYYYNAREWEILME